MVASMPKSPSGEFALPSSSMFDAKRSYGTSIGKDLWTSPESLITE